ncbi:hypothetical protein J4410_07045 [Candidatus Woesearchaeota archaeon]|nr:hypothetical protein [Candidatus Woesearchaeota archaeon]
MKNINKMVVLFFFVFILIGCGEEEPITLGIVSEKGVMPSIPVSRE